MKKIFWIAVLALVAVAIYSVYKHYNDIKVAESGAIQCVGCMSPAETERFRKENGGETADGQSEHKTMTARQEDATGFTNGQGGVLPSGPAQNGVSPNVPVSYPAAQTAQSSNAYAVTATQPVSALPPASDSQAPNAPNGAHFAGAGNYQWYRQGNVTYRVDTATGRSCVIYATMEEWRKQIVLSHGCGREA